MNTNRHDTQLKQAETPVEHAETLIEQAHEAYLAARDVTPGTRAAWLNAVADALEDSAGELVELAVKDTHLGEPRLKGNSNAQPFNCGYWPGS